MSVVKLIGIVITISFCSSCVAQKEGNLTIKLSDYEHANGNETKVNYSMKVPKSGYLEKKIISGSHEDEYRVYYQDSSVVYLMTDASGSELNYDNILSIADKERTARLFVDTLSLEGKNAENLYWKEVKLGDICAGYLNVPPDRKELLDRALSSVKKK